jgi:hypothetical protein
MRHDPTPDDSLASLQRYAAAFRNLVNAKVWPAKQAPAKAMRLNADSDWEFICVAMDIVDDACMALNDFLRFSLDGPTRYDNTGERYLRLYGVLSATYIQQEATRKLYALMNCPSPKDIDERFAQLEVRSLRHQVASHGTDYRVPGTTKTLSYVPVRIGLRGYTCEVTEGRGNDTRTVDLRAAVQAHCEVLSDVLHLVYEKGLKTLFRGQPAKIQEHQSVLDELRQQREGTLIIRVIPNRPEATPIQIKLVPASGSSPTTPRLGRKPNSRGPQRPNV